MRDSRQRYYLLGWTGARGFVKVRGMVSGRSLSRGMRAAGRGGGEAGRYEEEADQPGSGPEMWRKRTKTKRKRRTRRRMKWERRLRWRG